MSKKKKKTVSGAICLVIGIISLCTAMIGKGFIISLIGVVAGIGVLTGKPINRRQNIMATIGLVVCLMCSFISPVMSYFVEIGMLDGFPETKIVKMDTSASANQEKLFLNAPNREMTFSIPESYVETYKNLEDEIGDTAIKSTVNANGTVTYVITENMQWMLLSEIKKEIDDMKRSDLITDISYDDYLEKVFMYYEEDISNKNEFLMYIALIKGDLYQYISNERYINTKCYVFSKDRSKLLVEKDSEELKKYFSK